MPEDLRLEHRGGYCVALGAGGREKAHLDGTAEMLRNR
jgi:hypothetical protein